MNMHKKIHPASMLLIVFVLGALLGACGAEQPTGSTTGTVSGVVTVGTPTAGLNTCVSCHPVTTAEWETTRHANLNTRPSFTTTAHCAGCHDKTGDSQFLSPLRMVIACEACHSGGGAHAASGGADPIGVAVYTAGVISGAVSALPVSAQFATCTSCHQLLDLNDPASMTTPTTAPQHANDATEFITDTHFGTPNSWNAFGNTSTALYPITGYALDYASESVCTECHNPHSVNNINQEWAASAHAARTNFKKDPQGYFSDAWSHYNWSESSRRTCQRCHTASGFKAYADALGSGNSGLAEQIRQGQLSTIITSTPGWKPEMLKCSGCHSDFKGTLRNPGAIDAVYSYTATTNNVTYTVSNASFAYPDVNKSNVCVACHVGLESGDTVRNLSLSTAPTITSMDNIGFINSHYLTAGGTVFTATGYEFDERSYDNPTSYQHNQIGVGDFRSTGTAGPCVGCHMSRPNGNGDHLFLPVSRFNRVRYNAGTVDVAPGNMIVTGVATTWSTAGIDTVNDRFLGPDGNTYFIASVDSDTQITLTSNYTGTTATGQVYVVAREGARITGVASEVCFSCHAGATSALVDQLNEEREMFEAALTALERFLDTRGICFVEAYPYFHKSRTSTGTVSATTGSTIVTGVTTSWLTDSIGATDLIRTADGNTYGIQSVDSDAQITLKSPYLGPIVSGALYTIMMTGSANAVKDWDVTNKGETYGKNFMGSAFNFNLLEHDPGAYVHNRTYVKRLIYDSIDWLDDTRMNNTVGTSLNALSGTSYDWKADAMSYLLPNGILNGIPAERP
jgi:ribosomal protein L31